MECNLEPADRTLRLVAGTFMCFAGLIVVALSYLKICDSWWWIVAISLVVLGLLSIMSSLLGKCTLRKMIGH